jgi:hypothetical protein
MNSFKRQETTSKYQNSLPAQRVPHTPTEKIIREILNRNPTNISEHHMKPPKIEVLSMSGE